MTLFCICDHGEQQAGNMLETPNQEDQNHTP